MSNFDPEASYNQFKLKELPNSKIILSEECYKKMLSRINMCALSGDELLEYGTFLYGSEIAPNVIYFYHPSQENDYVPRKGEFQITGTRMHKELLINVERNMYECIAHVHTHPKASDVWQYFSYQDYYAIKSLQLNFQPSDGGKIIFFGGLLTVSEKGRPLEDEISFIVYDDKVKEFYKITNIVVKSHGVEYPLKKKKGKTVMNYEYKLCKSPKLI